MSIEIRPYTQELVHSVSAFNRRVAPARPPFQIPETPAPEWLPRVDGRTIYQESFLAVENGYVRGGYVLKQQEFSFRGRILRAAAYQNPISEGIADNAYNLVALKLIRDATRRQPLLFDLGIGSQNAAVARMHRAMGWSIRLVPFYFKINRAFRFLRNIAHLRRSPAHCLLLDATAFSGLGWAGVSLANAVCERRTRKRPSAQAELIEAFGEWTDKLWDECGHRYSMVGVRDARVLNVLYPRCSRFIRLKVSENGRVIGWAVVLDTQMSGNRFFGNMRLGSIIDCLARPEHAASVIAAATRALERRGVDLIVSNQSHLLWGRALKDCGFLSGPSNFLFATSPSLSKLLDEVDPRRQDLHLNRADGDGPIHL